MEFHVSAGAFEDVGALPVGWHLTIDNDASWQTSLEATVDVGAAALNASSLNQMRFGVLKNEFGDLKFRVSGTVIVTTDFVDERRIELTALNFALK